MTKEQLAALIEKRAKTELYSGNAFISERMAYTAGANLLAERERLLGVAREKLAITKNNLETRGSEWMAIGTIRGALAELGEGGSK